MLNARYRAPSGPERRGRPTGVGCLGLVVLIVIIVVAVVIGLAVLFAPYSRH